MQNLIKPGNLVTLLALLPFSCTDDRTLPVNERVAVDIVTSVFPPDAEVNEDIQIQLTMQASNGCYADLTAAITEMEEDNHYQIKGSALFASHGVCPDVIVSKDSTLTFSPESAGDYVFQVNEAPFKVRVYTITVN